MNSSRGGSGTLNTGIPAAVHAAFDRWLAALATREGGDALDAAVAAACSDSVVVELHGFHAARGTVTATLCGGREVATWSARAPAQTRFWLDGAIAAVDAGWRARYRLEIDEFVNGGWWTLWLADDGRISRLAHAPDDLPDHLVSPPGSVVIGGDS